MKKNLILIVKWLLTTTSFLLFLAAGLAGAFFLISIYTGQWHWYQRSGALLVGIGAILSTRKLLRVGLNGIMSGSSKFEMAASIELQTGGRLDVETKRDLISAYWGFWIVGVGTITWAFGDLIECFIARNMTCI